MDKVMRIDTEGRITLEAYPKRSSGEQLRWMYDQIGCNMIEIVHPRYLPGFSMVVDEEGLIRKNPIANKIASMVYGYMDHGQVIAGNVLIMSEKLTPHGAELCGLNDTGIAVVVSMLQQQGLMPKGAGRIELHSAK